MVKNAPALMAASAEPRDTALMSKADTFAGVLLMDLAGVPPMLACAAVGWYFDLVMPPLSMNLATDLVVFFEVTLLFSEAWNERMLPVPPVSSHFSALLKESPWPLLSSMIGRRVDPNL